MLKDEIVEGVRGLRVVGTQVPLDSGFAAHDTEGLLELVRTLLERNLQLQQALDSRVVIEQAKGILAERLSLDPDGAFELLRRAARNNRIRIHDLAQAVVQDPVTPVQIAEVGVP